jgi:hypothetical protein
LYIGPEVGLGGRYMSNAGAQWSDETGRSVATAKSSGMGKFEFRHYLRPLLKKLDRVVQQLLV